MAKMGMDKPVSFNYWAFIASSIFLLSLAIFSLIWFKKQKEAADLITHTYQVKMRIQKSFGLLLEAESNQRGYLINKDSSYIKNILHAESLLTPSLRELDSLVVDNPDQSKEVKKLKQLIFSRVDKLHTVMNAFPKKRNDTFAVLTSPGKILMDSIHSEVRKMETNEDRLLGKRTSSKLEKDNLLSVCIVLFAILAFIILIWSFLKIRNENLLRLQAQLDANLLEKLVEERTDEIKKINILLTEQNEQLARKNTDLSSFTSIASHDLKEPLRKIQMFANQIRDLNPEYMQDKTLMYFEKISEQAGRMKNLIDSVLLYAQTDDKTLGFRQTPLNDIARLALDNLSEKIKEKKAVVRIQDLPSINCRPDQMEQLFINLIDNGLKYSRPGVAPVLEITASRLEEISDPVVQEPVLKIDFRDNGTGFEEMYKTKIFEIFQRLHGRNDYPGTGVGLAICKRIAENHKGTITTSSVLGEGSVFSVILPINEPLT